MKKFLSLILAILMIVSTVPMAFATGETTTPEAKKALFDAVIELETKVFSSYLSEDSSTLYEGFVVLKENIWAVYNNAVNYTWTNYRASGLFNDMWYDGVNNEYLDLNPVAVANITEVVVDAINSIDNLIEAADAYTIIDTKDFVTAMEKLKLNFTSDEIISMVMMVGGNEEIADEKCLAAEDSWYYAINYCMDIPISDYELNDPKIREKVIAELLNTFTQENFDSSAAYFIEYATNLYNCLCGTHNFTVARDNHNGTHTGICDFCCQTVTVSHNYVYGVCNLCGAVDNCYFGNHTLDEATDNLDGTHTGTCDSCGQTVTSTHDYTAGICGLCGAVDNCYFGNHTINEATDNLDGTHTGSCDSCGQTVTLTHDYADRVCGLCGAEDEGLVEDSSEEDEVFKEFERILRKHVKDEELVKQIVDVFKALYNLIKNALKG